MGKLWKGETDVIEKGTDYSNLVLEWVREIGVQSTSAKVDPREVQVQFTHRERREGRV